MIESSQPVQTQKHSRILWLWISYWCFLLVIMHVPIQKTLNSPVNHTDKVIHFCLYFVLARLGSQYFLSAGKRLSLGRVTLWMLIYAVYAAVDEWLQPLTGRSMSLGDWLADMGGILASCVWISLRLRATTISEPTSRPKPSKSV